MLFCVYMNTTIQMRIDSTTKNKVQKIFAKTGLDLSSGLRVLFAQIIAENTFPSPYGPRARKIREQWDKEVAWALKHGKGYATAKEMHDDIFGRTKSK